MDEGNRLHSIKEQVEGLDSVLREVRSKGRGADYALVGKSIELDEVQVRLYKYGNKRSIALGTFSDGDDDPSRELKSLLDSMRIKSYVAALYEDAVNPAGWSIHSTITVPVPSYQTGSAPTEYVIKNNIKRKRDYSSLLTDKLNKSVSSKLPMGYRFGGFDSKDWFVKPWVRTIYTGVSNSGRAQQISVSSNDWEGTIGLQFSISVIGKGAEIRTADHYTSEDIDPAVVDAILSGVNDVARELGLNPQ